MWEVTRLQVPAPPITRLRLSAGCMLAADAPTSQKIADLSVLARFGDSNRMLQLSNVSSNKRFFIGCYGPCSSHVQRKGRQVNETDTVLRMSRLRRKKCLLVLFRDFSATTIPKYGKR